MRKKRILSLCLLQFLICSTASGQNISTVQKFLNESNQNRTLKVKGSLPAASNPQTRIHFYWTSWCEYCEQAYNSLLSLDKAPGLEGKVQILGYCLDEAINDKVKIKFQEMKEIDHYLLSSGLLKKNPELARLPAFIVEDIKTKRLEAYTGFTNERFHYLKKKIQRSHRSEQLNEE